jgi:transposase InsO family protein
MVSSMSRKGNCWDNAPTQSLWGSLKVGQGQGQGAVKQAVTEAGVIGAQSRLDI